MEFELICQDRHKTSIKLNNSVLFAMNVSEIPASELVLKKTDVPILSNADRRVYQKKITIETEIKVVEILNPNSYIEPTYRLETPETLIYPKPLPLWLLNIFNHTAEADKILFENNNILIVPDYKSVNHQLIFSKLDELRSVRDLNSSHLDLLHEIQQESVKYGNICYVHYPPSVWRLHFHVKNKLLQEDGFKSIDINTIIQNIKLLSKYYQQAHIGVITQ